MSEKLFVRKCERYTIWEASKPIEIDVEKLRKCDPPYEGDSAQEVLDYLQENVHYNYEWAETNAEIYGEDEEAIEFIPEGAAFSSISYQEKLARDNLSTYGHDFDGIGAQRIDYLIFSDAQVAPWVNHQTNPFGFPEGTLQSISEDYERHREKES